jgi:hypothetical protein
MEVIKMLNRLLVIFLGMLICAVNLTAYAKDASFRCGNGLIETGDSRARVLHHCGNPYLREMIGYIRSAEEEELIDFAVEAWTYDSAQGIFNIITFQGNRVWYIESERK